MSGGSAGTGRRGGLAAVDTQPDEVGGSWEYFRYGNAGRTFLWGGFTSPGAGPSLNNVILSTVGAGNGPDTIRAYPHIFPRGGTIGRMGWFNPIVYAGGGGELRFGLYSDNNGAPGTLLWQSIAFSSWPDPGGSPLDRWRNDDANIQVDAMSVVWLAWVYNDALRAAGQRVYCWDANNAHHLLGFFDPEVIETGDNVGAGGRIPTNAGCQIGWRAPQAYGSLPTTFPSTDRKAIAMSNATLEPSTLDSNILAVSFKWTPD